MSCRQTPPNILLIISDQHTPSVAGCYGNTSVRTPNLDRLAETGATFDNAYCNSAVCVPSRMSMLAGLHCDRIRVWHNADPLPPPVTTWPQALRLAGYDTAISGRMHLLWGDRMGGFGRRLCGDESDRISKAWPSGRKDRTNGVCGRPQGFDSALGAGVSYPGDEEAKDRAIRYLRERRREPFALCVGFYKPHAPFQAPSHLIDLYGGIESPPLAQEPCVPLYHPAVDDGHAKGPLPPDRVKLARQCYYGMVTQVDQFLGEILDTLEEQGLSEDTIVIYTSDHGEMLGRHQLWHKVCFYEDSVRVPLIVSCPSRFPRGERRAFNVSLLDLFPTFTDIAEHAHEAPLDGESLLPLLAGGALQREDEVMALSIGPRLGHPSAMLKRGHLKLICTLGFPPILFDLSRDPGECVDFSADHQYAEVLREMQAAVEDRWDPDLVNQQVEFSQSHLPTWVKLQEMRC